MFGFLKKKLSESVEKLKTAVKPKEEVKAEEVAEVAQVIEKAIEAKKEIAYKEKLIETSGYDDSKKIEDIVEKPYEPQLKAAKEIAPEITEPEPLIEKTSLLGKVKKALTEKKVSETDVKSVLWDLQIALVESDVALTAAEKITGDIKSALVGKTIKRGDNVEKIIKDSMRKSVKDIMKVDGIDIFEKAKTKKPFVIIFLGFNGSGKTTTIARIGHMLKKRGISCVFAAADTWRAAAIEQIEEHGKKLDIPVIKQKYGADPAAVIFDAVKHATSKKIDVVLADTAGRSHANVNLVDEMKKIIRVNKPDLKILVLDALTGNDIYEQCRLFNEAVGVDGLILTKADVYDKGGAALSAAWTIKKPLLFLGMGQEYEDLQPFDADKIVENLLG